MRLPRPKPHHVVIACLLLALAATSLLLPSPIRGTPMPVPTTYSNEPGGLQGLYLACEGLGLEVDRWTDALEALDPASEPALVVVGDVVGGVDPSPLVAWVDAGGTLLLASRDDRLLRPLGLAHEDAGFAVARLVPRDRAAGWDLPGELPAPTEPLRFPASRAGEVLVEAEGDGDSRAYVRVVERGAGRVVHLADPDLLVNASLDDPARAVLAVRLVEEAAGGGPVSFCETVHGFQSGSGPHSAMARMLARSPAGNAALGAACFLLLALLADAKQFGRVRRTLEAPRRSEYEYLDALAGLLVATRAWRQTADLLLLGLRRRIGGDSVAGRRVRPGSVADALAWDRPADAELLRAAADAVAEGTDPPAMARSLAALDAALPPERPRGERGPRTKESP